MGGWMDGWMDGPTDGWLGGWMDVNEILLHSGIILNGEKIRTRLCFLSYY